jgi:Ca2+/Na+ antiporter
MPGMPMNRRETVGSYILFALGIVTLVTTIFAVWRHFSPLPFSDSWDGTIGFYMRAMQAPWQSFFEQHNEHRLTFSRLIFFADVRYFGGRNVLSLIANLVLAGALATTFYRITLHHRATLSRPTRFGLAGGILIFTFSWIQNENFTWGFQSQWFAVYLAFHSIERTAEAEGRDQRGTSRGWFVAALASALVAAYSMSSGVLVLPVLIVQAAYLRLKRRDLAVLVAFTAAVWFAYFIDWTKPASSGNLTTGLREHPFDALRYVLLYLGAPAYHARLSQLVAYVSGMLALKVLVSSCIRTVRADERRPQGIAMLAFALFVAGNALLTASGRLWFGVGTALASRYTTASLTCWLALIIFMLLNSSKAKQFNRVIFVAAVATLIVASGQRMALRPDNDVAYSRLVAGLALRTHVYDPDITKAVYPFPDSLIAIAKQAEIAKLSIFAPDQPDYLVPPDHIGATATCDGAIENISTTTTPGIYRATGWLYDTAARQTSQAVVVTDTSGATLGTGVTGGDRDDIRKRFGRRATYSGWTALFKAPATGGIRISGEIAANTYCFLQGEKPMSGAASASNQ